MKPLNFTLSIFLIFVHAHANGLDPEWLKLLHQPKSLTGHFVSKIKDPNFFLSKQGSTNPEAEWAANIEAFNKGPGYACRFPARAHFIARKLEVPLKNCEPLQIWKSRISAESVTLVYVGQYISNPASMFGHHFLLFRSSKLPESLQATINNAAQMPPAVSNYDYIVKGMAGGFKAQYFLEPYVVKLEEYSNMENRSMWAYDLQFSSSQREQLLNHLWELSQFQEDYLFLTRNCAASILDALAAVHSRIDFLSAGAPYVLPLQTLTKIRHVVVDAHFKPSLRESLIEKIKHLDQDAKPLLVDFVRDRKTISSEIPQLYEAALDYLDYEKSKNGGQRSLVDQKSYDDLLLKRSNLGLIADPVKTVRDSFPERAHGTYQVATGVANGRWQIQASPFHHSLLQNDDGFLPFSELTLFAFQAKQKKSGSFFLQQFDLIRMANFKEDIFFDHQSSWKFSLSFKSQSGCADCLYFDPTVAYGKAFSWSKTNLFYALAATEVSQAQSFRPYVETGAFYKSSYVNTHAFYRWGTGQVTWALAKPISADLDFEWGLTRIYGRSFFEFKLGYFF